MKKKSILIITSISVVIIAILTVNYLNKQAIITQVESIATKNGLENVEVVLLEKSKEYGWRYIAVSSSNFDKLSQAKMKSVDRAINDSQDIYVSYYMCNGNKYELGLDSIYLNGKNISQSNSINSTVKEDYSMSVGMNGTYTYRCQRECDSSCKYCERSCVRGRENFGGSCTHQYSASSPIGWIGCPLCGDVDNTYWHDWYEKAIKE